MAPAAKADKAASYYYYSLGHLYSELASGEGAHAEYFNKAVESYKAALKADPSATFISEELSDLYVQSGHLRDAVTEAEELLKQNPNDISAHRILARIYTRLIGDSQHVDEAMLKKAIDQFKKIVEIDPKDVDSWLMLGRLQRGDDAEKAYKQALALDPSNDDAMTGLAMAYVEKGNNKEAAELLRKATDKDPNPRSLMQLAGTYEQMKEYAMAVEVLRRALELQPGNTDIEHALGEDLLRADLLDDALKMYQQLASDDPKDEQAELRLSQIYRQKHDFVKAREAASKAKEIDPENLEIRYNEVKLLEAEGKSRDAIQLLKSIVESTAKKSYNADERRNRAALLEELGFLYRNSEQYNDAVDVFRQMIDLDPDSAGRAEAQIVDSYRQAKDFTKAEAEADAAVKKYPQDRTLLSERASLMADMGKIDQAAAETKKLLNGKEDCETYVSLAQVYEKGKNWTEMGKQLDAAEKICAGKDEKENVQFTRAAMYERMKKYDEAEAEFRKVLAANPQNASALNYLGYMLADRNVKLEEAHELVNKALDLDPNNGAYLDSLGWVLFRLNRLPEAEEKLQQAIMLMSRDPTVHDHLGDVYFHEGKTREAIAQWQNSLKEYQVGAPSDLDREDVAKIQKKMDEAKVRLARENNAAKQQP